MVIEGEEDMLPFLIYVSLQFEADYVILWPMF
jgi:hypothetical protein